MTVKTKRRGDNYVDVGLGCYELGDFELGDDITLEARTDVHRVPGVVTMRRHSTVSANIVEGFKTHKIRSGIIAMRSQ